MKQYANQYYEELLNNIIPFWEKHSKDTVHGGFFTCLDQFGNIYDTDKFMWLQGRETWCFSMLYDKIEKKQQWLDMASHGASFMQQHGRDEKGDWYFSLTREGKPLVQSYNIFSDCFAAMAFAALYKINSKEEYAEIAKTTFEHILQRTDNPKGIYNKLVPGTRQLKNFALPMILCNLSLEMEHILGSEKVNAFIPQVIHEVMDVFYQPDKGLILENVYEDGSFCDSFEGRVLNPGHAIEAMWFIMDLGNRLNNPELIENACNIMLTTLEYGWDKQYGGIFYFLDIKGHPLQQLEWDQKLWWVHMETLVALAKGYAYTKNELCLKWFEIVHEYTWKHFKDPQYLEWFGYLNRKGEVLLPLKGGKWKGCFHNPRAMYTIYNTLKDIDKIGDTSISTRIKETAEI
jgi:N-acylglucosamine 2-epimerase